MGKSLEFVKSRIESGECNGMENNNYLSLTETSILDYLCGYLEFPQFENNKLTLSLDGTDANGNKFNTEIELTYNPEAKFDYFAMGQCVCDGTQIFFNDVMYDVISKVVGCATANAAIIPVDLPSNPMSYNYFYTIGDFVLGTEFGDEFSTTEKPWLNARLTAMLPITMHVEKHSDKTNDL